MQTLQHQQRTGTPCGLTKVCPSAVALADMHWYVCDFARNAHSKAEIGPPAAWHGTETTAPRLRHDDAKLQTKPL